MTKHTPGPWTVYENEMLGRDIVSAGSMALVCTQVYSPDDARLIAAAPEMLDLIKRSTTLLAETTEANEPRVAVHRDHLIALIKKLDPEYYGKGT
jgi:hypothetical protein